MVMDISIKEETPDMDYTITINGDKVIQTTIAGSRHWNVPVNKWIREMQRIYTKKGRNKDNIIVGLYAETQYDFYSSIPWYYKKLPVEQQAFDILKLCIGSHCLLFDLSENFSGYRYELRFKDNIPIALKNFVSDPHITFVGIGIDSVVKKLKRDHNLHVAKTMDLTELAKQALDRDDLGRFRLEKLAKVVLGDSMEVQKPNRYHGNDSQEVKYNTVDAFLSYQIGIKCMEIINSKNTT